MRFYIPFECEGEYISLGKAFEMRGKQVVYVGAFGQLPDWNEMIIVWRNRDLRVFEDENRVLILKNEFTYDYFVRNPEELFTIDLDETQKENNVFSEEELEHLSFLQRCVGNGLC